MRKILVTGSAGFIGFHLIQALLNQGCSVVGIDNLNDYYDPQLKHSRLDILTKNDKSKNCQFFNDGFGRQKRH